MYLRPIRHFGHHGTTTVERWEPLPITFTVDNSAASQPQFPYASGGAARVTVGRRHYRRTASSRPTTGPPSIGGRHFFFSHTSTPIKQNEEWLYPQGQAIWAVRFAPPSLGTWKYHLQVTEARGTAQSADGSFVVTAPTNPLNHGPVQVAPNNFRYFANVDGTPFLGSGYDIGVSGTSFSYDADQKFTAAGTNNENFFRWWLGGDLSGARPGSPWNSLTLGNDGYLPATGLTLDRAYGNGLASLRLDNANPVMIYGWNEGQVGLIHATPTGSECDGAQKA